jgi:hypothetical protein
MDDFSKNRAPINPLPCLVKNGVLWVVPAKKSEAAEKPRDFLGDDHTMMCMITILSILVSAVSFRLPSRASLELESLNCRAN